MSSYPCPTCNQQPLQTVVKVPYVRGFLLAYAVGSKRFLGCSGCVAGDIRKEALKSMLIGWFSITALILNPLFIAYNMIRSFFVSPNEAKVTQLLTELGMPDSPAGNISASDVGTILAACMIRADGEIEASEVHTLADEMKQAVYDYLFEIANADGRVSQEERLMLKDVASHMHLSLMGDPAVAHPALRQPVTEPTSQPVVGSSALRNFVFRSKNRDALQRAEPGIPLRRVAGSVAVSLSPRQRR